MCEWVCVYVKWYVVYVEGTSHSLETSNDTSVYKNDRNQWRTSKALYNVEYARDGFEVPAVLLFIGAPIIPSRVEAPLIPSIGRTRDPLWAVLRQDKYSRVCVCVQTVCLFFTYLNMFILYTTTTLMSPCYLLFVIHWWRSCIDWLHHWIFTFK